jgi:hypothetical protein
VPSSATIPAFPLWRAPQGLVDEFAAVQRVTQQQRARMMRLAAAMAARAPLSAREFVADDLALVMGVHRRTAATFLHRSVAAVRLPGLVASLEAGELTDRHVFAVVDEVAVWAPDDEDQQAAVAALVVARMRAARRLDGPMPTPGELTRRVRAAALLLDLQAAEKAKKSVAERRGVSCFQSAVGEGTLSLSGPEVQVVAVTDAIRARAEAYGRLAGDERTLDQRMFDAAYDLLSVDAAGGESAVPALDVQGQLVTIRVRGVEIQVLVPYSLTQGGELELAEIAGFGPILPSTARELLGQAEHVRQVAVDAGTGEVLAVEDRVPVRRDPQSDQPTAELTTEPTAEPAPAEPLPLDPGVARALQALRDRPLQHLGPQSSAAYRAGARVLRAIRARDRSCTFPGCTTPARWTDADHRDPWPRGATSTLNMHCLCRRHHRAKQGYFTVELDEHGNTIWTTPDGRRYRRPPPRF